MESFRPIVSYALKVFYFEIFKCISLRPPAMLPPESTISFFNNSATSSICLHTHYSDWPLNSSISSNYFRVSACFPSIVTRSSSIFSYKAPNSPVNCELSFSSKTLTLWVVLCFKSSTLSKGAVYKNLVNSPKFPKCRWCLGQSDPFYFPPAADPKGLSSSLTSTVLFSFSIFFSVFSASFRSESSSCFNRSFV